MARGPITPKIKKSKKQLRLKGISGKIKPTPLQLRIAKNLAAGMKKGEALEKAGVSAKSAKKNSAEIIKQPGVRAALAIALEEAGITTDRIAMVLDEGLDAKKVLNMNPILVLSPERAKEVSKDGFIDATKLTEEERNKMLFEIEDHPTRHRYLETSCKLMGLFPDEGTGEAVKLIFAYGEEPVASNK